MAYYNTCPKCGANLDPGEPCDCEEQANYAGQNIIQGTVAGQYVFRLERKTRAAHACHNGRENAR